MTEHESKTTTAAGRADTPELEIPPLSTSGPDQGLDKTNAEEEEDDDDEEDGDPDEWNQRINDTGCARENMKLQLCHYDTNDWRQCIPEMEAFKKCWADHNNNIRTHTVDNNN